MNMDMDMDMPTTSTSTVAAFSSTGGVDMSSMDHGDDSSGGMSMGGGGDGPACKISMLWNWTTVDACFLSSHWHITSTAMFAGSCIGVVLLVMVLEALRRASREYDAFIIRTADAHTHALDTAAASPADSGSDSTSPDKHEPSATTTMAAAVPAAVLQSGVGGGRGMVMPTLGQQLVRATLHMLQFAVAYFVMLLAMYFNGYIIICIFIGAFLGAFAFGWHGIGGVNGGAGANEITYCCG